MGAVKLLLDDFKDSVSVYAMLQTYENIETYTLYAQL